MMEEKRNLQYKLDTVTSQHSEEVAAHKLTQEKLDMLKSQMNDAKRSKVRTQVVFFFFLSCLFRDVSFQQFCKYFQSLNSDFSKTTLIPHPHPPPPTPQKSNNNNNIEQQL